MTARLRTIRRHAAMQIGAAVKPGSSRNIADVRRSTAAHVSAVCVICEEWNNAAAADYTNKGQASPINGFAPLRDPCHGCGTRHRQTLQRIPLIFNIARLFTDRRNLFKIAGGQYGSANKTGSSIRVLSRRRPRVSDTRDFISWRLYRLKVAPHLNLAPDVLPP